MQQIQATAAFTISPEHQAEFLDVAAELIAAVRDREPDTLQYLWYFSDDGSRCSVREIYRHSDAVLHHLENCADLLPRLFPLGEVTIELCGPVSDTLRAALAEMDPPILRYHDGIDRLLEV